MPVRLHAFDLGVVGVYLIAITLFGLRFARGAAAKDRSLRGYFLANRAVPWWAIVLSIVSAETSTLTIISIPGVAFAGDFGFLQIVFGYLLGRIVVAAIFLPKYFHGEMLTAYQLIDRRFGHTLHKVTAGLFLLTRAAAEGVRVFAVSIVVGIAIGTGDVLSIAIITALTLLYTFEGGMTAVIWTDVVQMAIYIGGTLVAIATLGAHVPGGWPQIHTVAAAAGKFHLFNFALNLTTTYTFWAGVLGGTFLTMASHGTDQLMVQRMLAAKDLTESRLALLSSGVVIFVQFALFLLIGAGLFVFYGGGTNPGAPGLASETWVRAASPDRIFPTFIVREMPVGIAGLLVAAILAAAMSNLSAALNSLSSTTVVDFYMGWRPAAPNRERILVSRASTVLWALVLFAVAVYSIHAGGKGHVVEVGLSIASVAYGCLLGVFLLGTLTSYATQWGTIVGMVTGFALNMALWLQPAAVRLGPVTVPKIAWTWYVLIGALATFAVGSLASLLFRKQSRRAASATIALPLLAVILGGASRPCDAQSKDPEALNPAPTAPAIPTTTPDFSAVSDAINTAIAQKKLPGAVVVIGHGGRVVFQQAYGARKLAGEPGVLPAPDGRPSLAAEPMTLDTIFDMASLTKCLVTATAIMQLYESGKIAGFDDPVAKYLPEFAAQPPQDPSAMRSLDESQSPNPSHSASANGATTYQPGAQPQVNQPTGPQRADSPTHGTALAANGKQAVTIRELLTHYSGLPPDVDLRDAWGLAKPDKAEGIRRAMNATPTTTPGTHFEYSDINYIVLGALVERLSGERLEDYAQEHIFAPLQMKTTTYHPFYCSPYTAVFPGNPQGTRPGGIRSPTDCTLADWYYPFLQTVAPTQHDDQGTKQTNPNFDALLRGTVEDPTTRRMGGVAGQAGVFSTAADIALFAQALLDRLAGRPSDFPLKRETLELMTTPQQPATALPDATIFTQDGKITNPDGKPNTGVAQRGFGWDINSPYSRPRGEVFPIGSFGHTGFTGTSLWMDPASDTYVILLANSIHPRGNPSISPLRGQVATAAARALGLATTPGTPSSTAASGGQGGVSSEARPLSSGTAIASMTELQFRSQEYCCGLSSDPDVPTLTGIDVLEATNFAALKDAAARNGGHLRIGLLTNQTGLDSRGRRTIDLLHAAGGGIELTTLFSPEHGIFGAKDSTEIGDEVDPTTGLHVISLYGAKDADRRPKLEDLAKLDAVLIDLQDAGVRFYTYDTVVGYFLEASSCETARGHPFEVVVLDRPDPIGGNAVEGPVSDARPSYTNYMPLPVRHGMTIGELAQYFHGERTVACAPGVAPVKNTARLTVIPMQNWRRDEFFDATGVPWVNPSPNLRSPTEAILYPGVAIFEAANVSVGRGTATPFEVFGAGATPATRTSASSPTPAQPAWFDGNAVAAYLTARHIPGVSFAPTQFAVAEDENHYPYHGQTIPGVRLTVTGRAVLDSPELGIEIVSALHRLYPTQFKLESIRGQIANAATMAALERGDDPRAIAAAWAAPLAEFRARRQKYLLYP
jgi:SSS family transporter